MAQAIDAVENPNYIMHGNRSIICAIRQYHVGFLELVTSYYSAEKDSILLLTLTYSLLL